MVCVFLGYSHLTDFKMAKHLDKGNETEFVTDYYAIGHIAEECLLGAVSLNLLLFDTRVSV